MNAPEALAAAHAGGINLRVDGDYLVPEACAPPPGAILDLLSSCKADIVALLRSGGEGGPAKNCFGQQAEKLSSHRCSCAMDGASTDSGPTISPAPRPITRVNCVMKHGGVAQSSSPMAKPTRREGPRDRTLHTYRTIPAADILAAAGSSKIG
jgi:hypothetical protein